jgi:hypothetical protein
MLHLIYSFKTVYIDSSMQRNDTSLKHLNWMQVYQLAINTILFYDIRVNKISLILLTYFLIV